MRGLAKRGACRHLSFLLELTLASWVRGRVPSPGIPRDVGWGDGEWGSDDEASAGPESWPCCPRDGGPAVQSGAQDWAQGQAVSWGIQIVGHGHYIPN